MRAHPIHTDLAEVIRQRNASFALEGFEPTDLRKAMDEAILAGRIDLWSANEELRTWLREHKSPDGFLESRSWS